MNMKLLPSLQFQRNDLLLLRGTLSDILSLHHFITRTISQSNHKDPKPRKGDTTDHGDLDECLLHEHADYFNRDGEVEPPCKRLAVGSPPTPIVSHSGQVPWPKFHA